MERTERKGIDMIVPNEERNLHSRTCNSCGETKTGDLMKCASRPNGWYITPLCLECQNKNVSTAGGAVYVWGEPSEPATKEELYGELSPFIPDGRHEAYCIEHRRVQAVLHLLDRHQIDFRNELAHDVDMFLSELAKEDNPVRVSRYERMYL